MLKKKTSSFLSGMISKNDNRAAQCKPTNSKKKQSKTKEKIISLLVM